MLATRSGDRFGAFVQGAADLAGLGELLQPRRRLRAGRQAGLGGVASGLGAYGDRLRFVRLEGLTSAPLGEVIGRCGLGLAEHLVALRRDLLGGPPESCGLVLEGLLDDGVVVGVEQRAQDLLPLTGVGLEELLEPALRQHDDLPELLAAESEQRLGLGADPGPARGQRLAVRDETPVPGAAKPPERRRLVVDGGAFAAELGPLLLGFAFDAVEVVAEREVEDHAGERLRGRRGRCAWRRRSGRPRFSGPPLVTPYRAKDMASSTVVLPEPVGPVMRKKPAPRRSAKSRTCWPAYGPKACMVTASGLTATPPGGGARGRR